MPGIYKIGYTDRAPCQRADELSRSTSIPTEFEVVVYGEVEDAQSIESDFHCMYDEYRISGNREFFRFTLDRLIREVCINLREYCLNFTYCQAYDFFNLDLIKEEKLISYMPDLLEKK